MIQGDDSMTEDSAKNERHDAETFKHVFISRRECLIHSDENPRFILLQPVDDHDIEGLESETAWIHRLSHHPFVMAAFRINDWNRELTPWDAPAVSGNASFGHGAEDTLRYAEEELLPGLRDYAEVSGPASDLPLITGGYSLAGLFALWSSYVSDRYTAVAAASPSLWYPGWSDYARSHAPRAKDVYLSLGDREEKTRNKAMAAVGDCIRLQHSILKKQIGEDACTLEWNKGNHFREPDVRCARAYAWCMNRTKV